MLRKIVSGGQTGVDVAALDVAKELGYETGGWMPRGFLTEAGPRPDYAGLYGVVALSVASCPARTRRNVEDADYTLALTVGRPTGGTALTVRLCGVRPHGVFDLLRLGSDGEQVAEMVRESLVRQGVQTLNVAGPRESKSPGVYELARRFLLEVLKR
jgi:hypothetical protein